MSRLRSVLLYKKCGDIAFGDGTSFAAAVAVATVSAKSCVSNGRAAYFGFSVRLILRKRGRKDKH